MFCSLMSLCRSVFVNINLYVKLQQLIKHAHNAMFHNMSSTFNLNSNTIWDSIRCNF